MKCGECGLDITKSHVTDSMFWSEPGVESPPFMYASAEGFLHMHNVTVFKGYEAMTVRAALRRLWLLKTHRARFITLRMRGRAS